MNVPKRYWVPDIPKKRNKPIGKDIYNSRAWKLLRLKVLDRDMHICQYCKKKGYIRRGNHVDHILPISQGGAKYSYENLQTLCVSCHSKKTNEERD